MPITSPDRNGYPTAGRQIGTGNGKAVARGVRVDSGIKLLIILYLLVVNFIYELKKCKFSYNNKDGYLKTEIAVFLFIN
ncbi:MAG TPA: hypothetical protein DF603_02740 [Chryseobacterium sp.]|nr:hypothetical protein [Chryseobacterium sp.]